MAGASCRLPDRMGRGGLAVAALAMMLAACDGGSSATPLPKGAAALRQVRVVAASEVRVPRTVSATGTLAAEDQAVLGTKVAGRLSQVAVDMGSRVRKGQPIARIDPGDYRLRVEQAEAALQQARARLGLPPTGAGDRTDPEQTGIVRQAAAMLNEARQIHGRMVELSKRQLISRAELDAATAQLGVAEGRYQDAIEEARNRQAVLAQRRSELELSQQQLADTVIVSPIDGAVRQRQATVGEYLGAGAPVATVVRIHPLRLRLAVPERDAPAVRAGQQVRLTVEGDRGQHAGRVVRLSPSIAEDNRTLLVEAEVPNEQGALRPGSFAKAEIVVEADQRVVTVPSNAVVTFAGIDKVFTVARGKAQEKRVRAGRRVGEGVEITEGLSASERVIVQPGTLVSGQPVTVVD